METIIVPDKRTFISTKKESKEIPVLKGGKGMTDPSDSLRTILKERFGCLIFRRIEKVHVAQKNYINTVHARPSADGISMETTVYGVGEMPPAFTATEAAQNVFENYSQFSITTSTDAQRKEADNYMGRPIKGHSDNYADFDLVNFTFVPCERTMRPREADLVCGVVDTRGIDALGGSKETLTYSIWFVCSEQFFRFWTLIMLNYHSSYDKIIEKPRGGKDSRRFTAADELALKRKVMAGNHLMTNGYRKWMLSCAQDRVGGRSVESVEDEIQKRFWVHRTECAANWVHYYAALILIVRYKEMPCDHNVPNNLNSGPFMTEWDLPQGDGGGITTAPTSSWIQIMCEDYSLYPRMVTREVEVRVFDDSAPPRGTRFVQDAIEEDEVAVDAIEVPGVTNLEDIEGDDNLFIPVQISEDEE
jgi:hypothetical protein